MRPSRAKMPATRAAGGFHPGALLLKLVFSSPISYNQLCELYTFNPGAGGLLGGRNFGTPARGVARTPAKTPARPQPTPSRRAQDGVVSWTLRGSPSHFNMQVRDPVEVFCRVRPDDSEEPCVQVNRNIHPCTIFFVVYSPSLVSDFFKIEIFLWQVFDDTSLKLVPPEASRGYNNKETQCSFKRENPF